MQKSHGQVFSERGKSLHYSSFNKFTNIEWQNIIDTSKTFIISSEAHEVSCNLDYSLSIINYISNKGYNNIILELPFSYGLICSRYLKTGDDSLLHFISGTQEALRFWKSLYEINKLLAEHNKLKIWGIDFELGGGGRRNDFFKLALDLLTRDAGKETPEILVEVLKRIETTKEVENLKRLKDELKKLSNNNEIIIYFGDQYPIFKILVNKFTEFQPKRDKIMYYNFLEIYNNFLKINKQEKFFAQFGWGHVRKSNKNGFAMLLNNDARSPVNSKTFCIGTQYINCYSNLPSNQNFLIKNSGVVNSTNFKKKLLTISVNDTSPIKIVNLISSYGSRKFLKESDALVVFLNFKATTSLKKL